MATVPSSASLWDYAAYAAIPFDGLRHEIIDGEHFVNSAPNLYHQEISRRLQFQLYLAIEQSELGVVINAPVDVQLSEHTVVQPDLVIIRKRNRHIMTPTKVKGIPDLLVEIMSPSNCQYDAVVKRKLYERCCAPETWIVDPSEHTLLQLVLEHGVYRESTFRDSIAFDIPPLLTIDLNRVW